MQFLIEFQAEHLKRTLAAVRQEMQHPEHLLGSIGESLFRVGRERHQQGKAPDGTAWKELAASTLAAGKRKGGPLNKTGRMLQSYHYQVAGDVLKLGFDGGRDALLARVHNDGTGPYVISAKKAKALAFNGIVRRRVHHPGLPKRRLVGFPDSDQQLVADVAEDHLLLVLKAAR